MATFSVPKQIFHGENALAELENLEGQKATIVTGGSSMKKFGFLDKAKEHLEKAGFEVSVVDGVEPNPSIETCVRGGKEMAEFGPDWIIALGGGSSLDAAKVMWVFYEYPGYDFQKLVNFEFPKLRTKARLACIPSTSGTASEITAFSVITDHEKAIKYPLVSPEIVPDVAIIDPALPTTMPPFVTADTGIDVLTHAIEAYVSTAADDYTDPLALKAIELVRDYLPRAYNDGKDAVARQKMHDASTLAGMAFSNCSLGIIHSMAHKIGGEFGIVHGESNAILMPYVIDYNRKSTDKYTKLEGELGIDNIAELVRELNARVGIAKSLSEAKGTTINEEDFKEAVARMAQNAYDDACTLTNPRDTSPEDIKKVYEAAYYGNKVEF